MNGLVLWGEANLHSSDCMQVRRKFDAILKQIIRNHKKGMVTYVDSGLNELACLISENKHLFREEDVSAFIELLNRVVVYIWSDEYIQNSLEK